jgi:hypothetical protein
MAALDAERWLSEHEIDQWSHSGEHSHQPSKL